MLGKSGREGGAAPIMCCFSHCLPPPCSSGVSHTSNLCPHSGSHWPGEHGRSDWDELSCKAWLQPRIHLPARSRAQSMLLGAASTQAARCSGCSRSATGSARAARTGAGCQACRRGGWARRALTPPTEARHPGISNHWTPGSLTWHL